MDWDSIFTVCDSIAFGHAPESPVESQRTRGVFLIRAYHLGCMGGSDQQQHKTLSHIILLLLLMMLVSTALVLPLVAAVCGSFGTSHAQLFDTETVTVETTIDDESFPFQANVLTDFPTATDRLSRYGGWADGPRRSATGYFRVERFRGRWWAIDPDGYLFLHKAVNSINLDDLSPREIHALLQDHGFNGMGNWSDEDVVAVQSTPQPLAYTPRFSFLAEYRRGRNPRIEMPVFDEAFIDFCREKAVEHFSQYVNDKNVFGYFSDNELSWVAQGLREHVRINDNNDKNYQAAMDFLSSRGKTANNFNGRDADAYTELMAEAYFSAVGPAIKAVDPNHLYLGTRLNKSWTRTQSFMEVAGRYLDVVAINHYHRWGTKDNEINNIVRWTNKPVLVSEFYAMRISPNNDDVGAGYRVENQAGRSAFFHNYVTSMIQNKNTVGFHWFKYQDDDNGNKGVISQTGGQYNRVLNDMEDLNKRIYQYTAYVDSNAFAPDQELGPEADAFFQGTRNYGRDDDLEVKDGNSRNIRQTYLRFDLSRLSNTPESAVLKLFSLSDKESEAGFYQLELVEDNSWGETTINGNNNPDGTTVLHEFSHSDDIAIDVTDVVKNRNGGKLSLRIVSTVNNGGKPSYASRENNDAAVRPKMMVYY